MAVFDLEMSNFHKFKEIEHLRGGVHLYAAQANARIDADIAEQGRFRSKIKLREVDHESINKGG